MAAGLDAPAVLEVLAHGEVADAQVLPGASNLALRVRLEHEGITLLAVHKPTAGERPLRDFPLGTLAARETAAHAIARAGGWELVPPTVRREGPWGPGSFQVWVEGDDTGEAVLVALPPGELPGDDSLLPVLAAQDEHGRPLVLAHPTQPALRSLAALDVLLDNADRKASHVILTGQHAGLVGIDHGLCLNAVPRLRTVLWGWAGEPLDAADAERARRLARALGEGAGRIEDAALAEALTGFAPAEVEALRVRAQMLAQDLRMPLPDPARHVLPWPLW